MTNIEKFKKKLAYIIYTKSPENLVLLRKILRENVEKDTSPVGGFDYYFVEEPNGNVYHCCDKADFSKHLIYNLEGIRIEDFYQNKTINMKKQSLKRSQLKELMNISDCYDWFNSINEILKSNVVDDEIEIEQKFIDLLIEEGNVKQRDAVKKLGIVLEKDTTLDTLRGSSKHFDFDDKYNSSNMICVRKHGQFKDKSYFLNPNFEWEIKEDVEGCKCLVPKK